jgi:uncharacterized membrane protein
MGSEPEHEGDVDDQLAAAPEGSDTARLETFADGVMAIAITLLVLDIHVPEFSKTKPLAHELGLSWPSVAAFATSFLVIGIIWVNHHRMFKLIARTNHTFLMINVVFLMVISFIPFPTALVAAALKAHTDVRTATIVYGGTMIATALMFNAVWLYASKGMRLLVAGLDPASIAKGTKSYRLGPISYVVVTLVAFIDPYVCLALFAAMALYWLLPSSGPGG